MFCIGCSKESDYPKFPADLNYFPYSKGQELKFTNSLCDICNFEIIDKSNDKVTSFNSDCTDCFCAPSSSFKTNKNQDLIEISANILSLHLNNYDF